MRNITIAFVRLPELVQGIILTIGSVAYLWMLSGKMLLVTAIWMAITIWGGFTGGVGVQTYGDLGVKNRRAKLRYTDFSPKLAAQRADSEPGTPRRV